MVLVLSNLVSINSFRCQFVNYFYETVHIVVKVLALKIGLELNSTVITSFSCMDSRNCYFLIELKNFAKTLINYYFVKENFVKTITYQQITSTAVKGFRSFIESYYYCYRNYVLLTTDLRNFISFRPEIKFFIIVKAFTAAHTFHSP